MPKIVNSLLNAQNASICMRMHQNVCRMNCAKVLCTKLSKKCILLHLKGPKLTKYICHFMVVHPVVEAGEKIHFSKIYLKHESTKKKFVFKVCFKSGICRKIWPNSSQWLRDSEDSVCDFVKNPLKFEYHVQKWTWTQTRVHLWLQPTQSPVPNFNKIAKRGLHSLTACFMILYIEYWIITE